MNVKTVVRFIDKKEGVTREIGDVFRVSKERYEEILKVGPFVEAVPETRKRAKKAAGAE